MDQPTTQPPIAGKKPNAEELLRSEPRWLLPRFALYTLLILTLTAFSIVWMTKRSASSNAEQQVTARAVYIADGVLRDRVSLADLSRPLSGTRLQRFDRLVRREVLYPGLVRVKLYNSRGLIVYSTTHGELGLHAEKEDLVKVVKHGQIFHDVGTLGAEDGFGGDKKALESYVPLRLKPHGRPVGMVEFYQDYAPVAAEAQEQLVPLASALAASLFALYLALFPVLRRTTKALRQRNKLLADQAVELKDTLGKRLEAEEALRQTQKMDAVGRLAGGIAHDFNNLLLVIRGYTSLLLTDLEEEAPMRHDVEEIEKAAEKATSLTSQLLTFSRRQPIHFKTFDIHDAVEESYNLLSRLLTENIQVFVDPNRDPCYVHADSSQLAQVIMNLAVNSRDAMPDGGTLRLRVREVERKKSRGQIPAGHYIALSISDNGTGIPDEHLPRIFEPFYTTKDVGKGTGLGLAIVYGIVAQTGGFIDVESKVGKGTTFTILLPPATDIPVGTGTVRKALPQAKMQGTILLVEDEPAVRQLLSSSLAKQGFDVLEAENGVEALEMAARYDRPIQLLLTDVVMPEMGGPQLADRLAQHRPEIKVLFISGHPDRAFEREGDGEVPEALLADGEHFLQKPFEIPTLIEKIQEILGEPTPAVKLVPRY